MKTAVRLLKNDFGLTRIALLVTLCVAGASASVQSTWAQSKGEGPIRIELKAPSEPIALNQPVTVSVETWSDDTSIDELKISARLLPVQEGASVEAITWGKGKQVRVFQGPIAPGAHRRMKVQIVARKAGEAYLAVDVQRTVGGQVEARTVTAWIRASTAGAGSGAE